MKNKRVILFITVLCILGWVAYKLSPFNNKNYITETIVDTSSKTVINKISNTKNNTVNKTVVNESSSHVVQTNSPLNNAIKTIEPQANSLNPKVLKASLKAYFKAQKLGLNEKQILTIVDYSLPSTARRLWVIDMKNLKVLFNTWVAHGTNSGGVTATSFSNKPSSLKSSLGVFITDEPYTGGKGYSLRIKGLEHNINDNAYNRTIVFHGAWYVSSNFAKARGMMGRSWGCFAVDNQIVKSLINTIKEKTLVVAYFPDKIWLQTSNFIN